MELRSNRSRSRTPFLQTEIDQIASYEMSNHTEKFEKHSYTTRSKIYKNSKTLDVLHTSSIPVKQETESYVHKVRQATSDYSSDDGENEISSSKSETEKRSQTGTYSVSSTNGQIKSALQVYKEAGDYWNKYPKTDYTYSLHSKSRTEVAPGVVAMPNMSRRSLHRSDTSQESFTTAQYNNDQESFTTARYNNDSVDYGEATLHRRHMEPKSLFRNNNSYYSTKVNVHKVSLVRQIYQKIVSFFFVIYQANISALLWIGRSYYKFVSNILMLDTWLLQRTSQNNRWKALIALFFLPLLVLAGWWMCSAMGHVLQTTYNSIITARTETSSDFQIPKETLSSDFQIPIVLDLPKTASEKQVIHINEDAIVQKVLNNLNIGNIINKQDSVIKSLENEVRNIRMQLEDSLENWRTENIHANTKISVEIDKCCSKEHITKILADLIQLPHSKLGAEDITEWLKNIFVAKYELEQHLSNLTHHLHSDLEKQIESSSKTLMHDISEKISAKMQQKLSITNTNDGSLSDSQIYLIVKDAIAVYDADKTGLVDYALESSGGQILSTRCTENYNSKTAVLFILGFPLWYPSNTPRIVITPGVTPGECWAFQGFPGFLVIQLTGTVKISGFSLEHIPKSLMPGGHRDSAPKHFRVNGLQSEKDNEPWQLGEYEYDVDGTALQYFPVQKDGPVFNIIELIVDSNHGNIHYTCLYRFRVHGNLSNEPT